MLAALKDRYGPPEAVRLADVPAPKPGEDEIVVRVRAASVNRADLDGLRPRPGFIRLFAGLRRPRSPWIGIDVAGVVETVGSAVTQFGAGDRVFADLYSFNPRSGAFSELVCAPERSFAPIPEDLSFEDAATLPHSGVLAIQGLRLRNGRTIRAGDRVLIDGASGNVGPFAVQVAKARGAHVTGVCHGDKAEFVRSLGADEVLDYTTTDYTRLGRRWDWIVDTDSHHPIWSIRRSLSPGGAYVTLGGEAIPILQALTLGPLLSRTGNRSMGLLLWWKPFHRPDVEALEALLAAGTVRPRIDRRYPLTEVVQALRWVDDGHARGKVLVIPGLEPVASGGGA
jgi:NADPH:quinone reductase-like Zn-dependent oxidoreductase